MIWDSTPWKHDLARRHRSLNARRRQKRWSNASRYAVERDAFIVAYEIRKLLDAKKLPDELENASLRAASFPPLGEPIHLMNWDKLDHLYDLENSTATDVSLREFCNQFIHSFVFIICTREDCGLDGFLVTSERDRYRRLLMFSIDDYLHLLRQVVEQDILSMTARRDPDSGEVRITSKSGSPSPRR